MFAFATQNFDQKLLWHSGIENIDLTNNRVISLSDFIQFDYIKINYYQLTTY